MAANPTPRVSVAVINDHLPGLVEAGFRKSPFMYYLRKRGRIAYNAHSHTFDWRMRKRRNTITATSDMTPRTFKNVNRFKTAQLTYVIFDMAEYFTEVEREMAKNSRTALIKVVSRLVKDMTEDFNRDFPGQLYADGVTNGDNLMGIESLFPASANTSASAKARVPSSAYSYAGVNTKLQAYGGNWTGNWPEGKGDLLYEFWTPLWIDVSHSGWDADTKSWRYTWRESLEYAETHQIARHNSTPDLYVMSPDWWRKIKRSIDEKERVIVDRDNDLIDIGFKAVNFEGTPLVADYYCPADTAYGLDFDNITLRCMYGQLVQLSRQEDIDYACEKLALRFMGQLQFHSPAFVTKFTEVP